MQSIIDAIEQWLKDFLIGAITGNLSSMFSDVNSKVATIATEVGKTPESWNSSVFSIILTLSRNVVVPIAGLVIAAVLTYELISMIIEKNNMHDIDTFMFFNGRSSQRRRQSSLIIPLISSWRFSRLRRQWFKGVPVS